MSRQSRFSVDEEGGLTYLSAHESAVVRKGTRLSQESSRSAFESIAKGNVYDTRRDQGANATQRLYSEAKSLVSWARSQHWLIELKSWHDFAGKTRLLDGGCEHQVFVMPGRERVIKSTIPPSFGAQGRLADYGRNQLLANRIFGDDIRFLGVLAHASGVSIITSQPYVAGEKPTIGEICNWFQAQGYESVGHNRWMNRAQGIEIADSHTGNLIKNEEGFLVPIDLQILSAYDFKED